MNSINFFLVQIILFLSASAFSQNRIVVFDCEVEGKGLTTTDGKLVANSIRTNLAKFSSNQIKVLERDEMVKLFQDRYNAERLPSVYDESTALELGKLLEANYVVFGRVLSSELFGIRISARLVSVEKGTILSAEEVSYKNQNEYEQQMLVITLKLLSFLSENKVNTLPSETDSNLTEILNDFSTEYNVSNLCSFKDSISHRIADVLNNHRYLINKLYMCKDIPPIAGHNAKLIHKLNFDSKLIAIIDIDFSNQGLGFVFSENGINWQIPWGKDYQNNLGLSWDELKSSTISLDFKKKLVSIKKLNGSIYYTELGDNGLNTNLVNLLNNLKNILLNEESKLRERQKLEVIEEKQEKKENRRKRKIN